MPGKYGFGNSRKKSPFKLKGMDFGTGTGSSPLNKNEDSNWTGKEKSGSRAETKAFRKDRRDARRAGDKEAVKKITQDIKSSRKARRGKVAPTATPVNDASMKNYNKAVDARTGSKSKAGTKIDAPKPQADKSKAVAKPVVKKTIDKVPTKRGTGVTYKAAWDADKGGVKSKYKDYASFEKAAKDYNRASKGVMKSDANKKKPTGPQNKK